MNGSRDVMITSYSQPHVLRQRMEEVGLRHGDTVMADISNVRLEHVLLDKSILFFCPSDKIIVNEKIAEGDGGLLPGKATLIDLKVRDERPGLYNLKNVKLHSNGTLQVIATEETVFEPVTEMQQRFSSTSELMQDMLRQQESDRERMRAKAVVAEQLRRSERQMWQSLQMASIIDLFK